MLGKLFTYELRALWKPAAIMLAVMVAAGLCGTGCLGMAMAISDAAGYGNQYVTMASLTSNATVVMFLTAMFCGFLVWASIAALYVFVVMRFYRTLFTDEGYLTLTLPVRSRSLVMAKFWAAYMLLVVFAFIALLLYMLMVGTLSGGSLSAMTSVLSVMGGWFAFAADGDAASVALGLVNVLVMCAYALGLAFASLSLGAWWARRHKVAAAVGIYLAAGWVLSLVFSIIGVLAMAAGSGAWEVALGVTSVTQLLVNVGVAVGGVALACYLVRAKVDLS